MLWSQGKRDSKKKLQLMEKVWRYKTDLICERKNNNNFNKK